jgi:hypothetical protein
MARSNRLQRSAIHCNGSLLRCNPAVGGYLVVIPVIIVVIPVIVVVIIAIMMVVVVTMITAMFIAVVRNVHFLVPIVFDEVNLSAAGIVPSAIPTPVARMVGRHMQIQRLNHRTGRPAVDDNRPGVDNGWWSGIAEINLAIEARLPEAQRHADVCGGECGNDDRSGDRNCK